MRGASDGVGRFVVNAVDCRVPTIERNDGRGETRLDDALDVVGAADATAAALVGGEAEAVAQRVAQVVSRAHRDHHNRRRDALQPGLRVVDQVLQHANDEGNRAIAASDKDRHSPTRRGAVEG